MIPFLLDFALMLLSLPGSGSVRIVEMKVPPRVQAGEAIQLACRYDLEGASLYSLNWWRGSEQFYQFSPNNQQPVTIYDSPGINVDLEVSGHDIVVLRNVTRTTGGRYKCEVLADYPSFEKDTEVMHMEVVDVPAGPPRISVLRVQWSPGEVLEANCSSSGTRPPPQLHWYINGDKILARHTLVLPPGTTMAGHGGATMDGSVGEMRTSNLQMTLRQSHFRQGGKAALTCAATLPGLYHRSAEVLITLPGFRVPAPSQKLYGSSTRISLTWLLQVLNLAVLFVCVL